MHRHWIFATLKINHAKGNDDNICVYKSYSRMCFGRIQRQTSFPRYVETAARGNVRDHYVIGIPFHCGSI